MGRESSIIYNPRLSAAENAKKNGVSEAGIRYYIKANGIDRRFERKQNIIEDCRKYLKKHPAATKTELHKKTKHSISTIRQYWEFITSEKELMVFDNEKAKKRLIIETQKKQERARILSTIPREEIYEYLDAATPKKKKNINRNRKELWSDVLKDIPKMFQKADSLDVSGLRDFLFEKPEMPMLFIGSGGQNSAVPAFLYGLNKGIGRAITPLQFASLSEDTIKNSRILLLSKSGKNDDIKFASERAVKLNPENTACLTFRDTPENNLLKSLKGSSAKVFLFNDESLKTGFTSVCVKFLKYGMFYKAFTGANTVSNVIDVDLSPEHCFKIELNKALDEPVNLEKVEHLCVLYGGYGEPVAHDLESVMTESGLASVQVCDYRNYCHGRFVFPTNHTENDEEPRHYTNVAMLLFVSPRERFLAAKIRQVAVPIRTPVITIETEQDNAIGLLDMLVKSNVFVGYFGEHVKRINPYSPPNYHAKDNEVAKWAPKNISFIEELRNSGELTLLSKR